MKLSDYLKRGAGDEARPGASTLATRTARDAEQRVVVEDPVETLRRRAQEAVLSRMGPALFDASLSAAQLDQMVVSELTTVLDEERIPLSSAERDQLVATITDQVLGYGPVERFLADPTVNEIMVNGLEGIYVERSGRLELTDARFLSEEHILRVIDRIIGPIGRRIDESSPMVDARLSDGSRVNAIIPPLALDGPVLTIRKFAAQGFEFDDLTELGTLTPDAATFLAACVAGRMNILISGGTGTGKTTLLNALSATIPAGERIVTIEDAAELRLRQRHVIRLESRPPNIEGRGEVRARDLVRNALRMRPDRIVVGEVRGAEALDMLQAMNTGHEGSMSTLHANSPRDALSRVETMVLTAGIDLPVRAIREQLASALDVLVHLARARDGRRRVTAICSVDGMEGDVITLTDVFAVDHAVAGGGRAAPDGLLRPTGVKPRLVERINDRGVIVPPDLFSGATASAG